MSKRAIIIIKGQVQGVFFRDSVRQKAQELGLVGHISNKSDGSVRIEAEGSEQDLQDLAQWCYNGVKLARVEKVDISWSAPTGQYSGFDIKY